MISEPPGKQCYHHYGKLCLQCSPTLKSEQPLALQKNRTGNRQKGSAIDHPRHGQIGERLHKYSSNQPHDHTCIFNAGANLAKITVGTPNQDNPEEHVALELLGSATQHPDSATNVINQLFHVEPTIFKREWYPITELCLDPPTLNPRGNESLPPSVL